jgi:hypothetical protein
MYGGVRAITPDPDTHGSFAPFLAYTHLGRVLVSPDSTYRTFSVPLLPPDLDPETSTLPTHILHGRDSMPAAKRQRRAHVKSRNGCVECKKQHRKVQQYIPVAWSTSYADAVAIVRRDSTDMWRLSTLGCKLLISCRR